MAYENSAGLGVTNHYGARTTGGAVGQEHRRNGVMTVTVDLTGEMLNSAYVAPTYIPKGCLLKSAILRVDEVFVVSAAGTVALGGAVPGTNGVVLTEAKLEAVGTSLVSTLAVGTWATASATGTTASEKLTKSITGTVGATSGKGTLILEFEFKTKV
jgi:hypothetical protein